MMRRSTLLVAVGALAGRLVVAGGGNTVGVTLQEWAVIPAACPRSRPVR